MHNEQLLDQAILFHIYQKAYDKLKQTHPKRACQGTPKSWTKKTPYAIVLSDTRAQCGAIRTLRCCDDLARGMACRNFANKGGFRGNLMAIANILQGKTPTTADDTRLAWQSVFLICPSFPPLSPPSAASFDTLEPGTLGWVLIDEAGQAIPQAAVGAIWRAGKVLSIGDPFQIEPICTIPAEVIDGMAKSKIKDYTLNWAPLGFQYKT